MFSLSPFQKPAFLGLAIVIIYTNGFIFPWSHSYAFQRLEYHVLRSSNYVSTHAGHLIVSLSELMAEDIRRSVRDEGRIRAREAKLLERELQLAASKGLSRLRCPCNLCMKEQHSLKTLRSYRRCLRANRRHPWYFGYTEVCVNTILSLVSRSLSHSYGSWLVCDELSVTIVACGLPSDGNSCRR